MLGAPRWARGIGWLVAACLIAACSSPSAARFGPFLSEISDEIWSNLYGEGKLAGAPPSITPVDLDAYLSDAEPSVRALLEHATGRGFGDPVEAAAVAYPDGFTATIAVTPGPDGRVGLVVGNLESPEGGYFTTADEHGILEVSTSQFIVRFQPDGGTVEGWDVHSSCKVSHCIGAAVDYWADSFLYAPLLAGLEWSSPECLGDDPWADEACVAATLFTLAIFIALVPPIEAAVYECAIHDACGWCTSDSCGSDEATGRLCTFDAMDRSPEHDYVLLETFDHYYCSNPDEYQRCETRGDIRLIEGCPYGCDGTDTCASPPPTCDPAACERSFSLGPPRCEQHPDDGAWVVVQDYDEQSCAPVEPRGETCVPEQVTRILEECRSGCAADGRSCGWPASLTVYEPASPDAFVPCAACRVQLQGVGGTFQGTTMIDGSIAIQGLPAGLYVVSGGCGPTDLGPHLPSDLVLHPGVPTDWVLALGPQMDDTIELPNVVVPFEGPVDVLIRNCG